MSILLHVKNQKEVDETTKLRMLKHLYLSSFQNLEKTNNRKQEYRAFCGSFTELLRHIPVPQIRHKSKHECVPIEYECVLVEFRKLPHLEFLIRNAVIKLGADWSHTIVCGLDNFEFLLSFCHNISPNIRVIRLPLENVSVNDYNDLICSLNFWNLLYGEKILLYQEDTCIFQSNIQDFLQWDYIGASWVPDGKINSKNVGNGGFSLRNRRSMIKVIKTKTIQEYSKGKSVPEDIYFTNMMLAHNLGKVAEVDQADLFSSEYKYHPSCFGSHCFFLYFPFWRKIIFDRVIVPYMIDFLRK